MGIPRDPRGADAGLPGGDDHDLGAATRLRPAGHGRGRRLGSRHGARGGLPDEAVGHSGLPDYLAAVSRLLRPDGLALLQAILIPDQRYESYRRSVDFTQRHVFPGGLLPSLARIQTCAATASDLRLLDLEDLTAHYPPTLAAWRARFEAHEDRIAQLGVSRWERRKWRFYFAYCEAGFLERTVSVAQLLYANPGFRGRLERRRWTPPL